MTRAGLKLRPRPHTGRALVSTEPSQPPLAADDLPSAAPGEYVSPLVARFRYWPYTLIVAAIASIALTIIYNNRKSNPDDSSQMSHSKNSETSGYSEPNQGAPEFSLRRTGEPVVTAIQRIENIVVPSDPTAKYYLLYLERRSDGLIEIVSRREGRSGISYAKRLIDCASGRALYLGEGDTLEQMQQSTPDAELWELCCGSISAYVAVHACDRAGSPMARRVTD